MFYDTLHSAQVLLFGARTIIPTWRRHSIRLCLPAQDGWPSGVLLSWCRCPEGLIKIPSIMVDIVDDSGVQDPRIFRYYLLTQILGSG